MALPGRTTPELVGSIAEIDLETVPDITPFIDLANELVTELCTASGYSVDRLEKIERCLAAHFYHIRDAQLVREEVSTLRLVYQQQVQMGLDQTRWGQQAKLLDTAGNLAALDNKMRKILSGRRNITWLGKDEEETV